MFEKSKFSILAVLSFVLIIVFLIFTYYLIFVVRAELPFRTILWIILFSIPVIGLLLSILAYVEIKKSLKGKKVAIIEMILNSIIILLLLLVAVGSIKIPRHHNLIAFPIGPNSGPLAPTYENPVVLPEEVIAKSGKNKLIHVGFYNKDTNIANNVTPKVDKCSDIKQIEPDFNLTVLAIPSDVEPGMAVGIIIALKIPENLSEGEYNCSMKIGYENNVALKDFTLRIKT